MHIYEATVERVVDGDTVVLNVDLGFGVWLRKQSFRLLGINAREKSDEGGREARENLAALLGNVGSVIIKSVKIDKYGGRFDADIFLADGTDLCARLVTEGWAAPWDGHGEKSVPVWPRQIGTSITN